jgi:hypothetical protein
MFDDFREVVTMDFEYHHGGGGGGVGDDSNLPTPVCHVAHELKRGRKHRVWRDQFGPAPPHPVYDDVLVVAYTAAADINCYRVLGWPIPGNVLDPYVEFRLRTNGLHLPHGSGLIGAMIYFGLDTMGIARRPIGATRS